MKIVQKRVADLVPYARNPRKNDDSINGVAASIKEFGFKQPIVIDRDGVIVVGHTRAKAAQKLGLETVPCVVADELTPEQVKAYRLLDNKLNEKAEWEPELLALELEEITLDLEPFEVDFGEDIETAGGGMDIAEDDIPEPGPIPVSRRGDMWKLGTHAIICGDSRDLVTVQHLFGASSADLLVTDPPYGVSYVGKTADALEIENDDLDEDALAELWSCVLDAWVFSLREGGSLYAAVPAGPLNAVFQNELRDRGILRQCLVWIKDSMVLGHSDYHYKHEPILYGWKPGAAHYFTSDRTKTSVLDFARPKVSAEHPTMKPVALWAEFVANSSRPGDLVCDPFLGSGTTLIACEQLGRTCFGMELSPQYVDVAIRRWQKLTGKDAVLEATGETFNARELAGISRPTIEAANAA